MTYNVAVVGATGSVGREMLDILYERGFPSKEVYAVASKNSKGKEVSYGEGVLRCHAIEEFDFAQTDIVLMSAGSAVAEKYAPIAAKAGAIVIDNSSFWRYHTDVPLIVPEVNPEAIHDCEKRGIIANPNCSTAQLVVALKPLHDKARIKRVVVSTYQSVSGAGKDAIDELFSQTKGVFTTQSVETKSFTKRMAFNIIPHIDVFLKDGSTKEEWKVKAETAKIMGEAIPLTCTAVRVPVFVSHSESVNIEFYNPITDEEATEILSEAPGCLVVDRREDGGYITPWEAAGEDAVYITRIRQDTSVEYGLDMFVVSDNLRKGAALNSVQIAELLISRNLARKAA